MTLGSHDYSLWIIFSFLIGIALAFDAGIIHSLRRLLRLDNVGVGRSDERSVTSELQGPQPTESYGIQKMVKTNTTKLTW